MIKGGSVSGVTKPKKGSFVTKRDGGWWVGQKSVILASLNYWTAPYLSSVFKILRKQNKIFQDIRISADLADSALGYHGIFEGWMYYLSDNLYQNKG